MVCLDTSFIVDLLRGNDAAVRAKTELDQSKSEISIATPTIVELMRSAYRNKNKDEERIIKRLVQRVRVLPLDRNIQIGA